MPMLYMAFCLNCGCVSYCYYYKTLKSPATLENLGSKTFTLMYSVVKVLLKSLNRVNYERFGFCDMVKSFYDLLKLN